jgi:AcrR family transcriptional regulator
MLGVGSVRDRILGPTRSTHGQSHARIRSTAGGARRDRRRRTGGRRGGAARKRLGATKGSFYWHFADREALVEAALADWEHSHTAAVIAEIETSSDDPLQQLRLLFRRVTALAARDRIELALLATADHPTVQPVLDRVTRQRVEFVVGRFQRLGFSRAQARRRALLAYSAYVGHAQLVHATPQLLPGAQAAKRAYLNDVLLALTSPPSGARQTRS